jgi:hypothetical protein
MTLDPSLTNSRTEDQDANPRTSSTNVEQPTKTSVEDDSQPPASKITFTAHLCIASRWAERRNTIAPVRRNAQGGQNRRGEGRWGGC